LTGAEAADDEDDDDSRATPLAPAADDEARVSEEGRAVTAAAGAEGFTAGGTPRPTTGAAAGVLWEAEVGRADAGRLGGI
jgi:hypothetical protein